MAYAAVIQGIMQIAGAAVAANSMQKARGGYEAQMGKTKRVEPIRGENPELFNWENAFRDTLSANAASRPQRQDEARSQNTFNLGEAKRMYRSMQPYFDQLQSQTGKNALSFSRGELPADVVSSIGRAAAQRGLQGGFGMGASAGQPGSALSGLNLRNLGLTSLDLAKYGTDLSMRATAQAQQLSPGLASLDAQMLNPAISMGYASGNVDKINESNRYWNTLENQAEWDNVATLNHANEAIANANLASRSGEAQMWAQLGQSSGSAAGASGGGGGGGGGGSMMSMFGA
jgi:hypothetical protein